MSGNLPLLELEPIGNSTRIMSLRILILATFCLIASCGSSTDLGAPASGPDAARLVTADIPRFWTAFDAMTSASDTLPLRRDYLDSGTDGLKDFTRLRWKDAKTLAGLVWPRR